MKEDILFQLESGTSLNRVIFLRLSFADVLIVLLLSSFYVIIIRNIHLKEQWNINILENVEIKHHQLGFPGGAVVGSLPANAGDAGSSPDLGRSHMPQSGWARGPQLLSLRVWSLCSATGGAAMVRGPRTVMRSGPRLPQLEKALAQKRRPNIAINQLINKKINL